MQRNIGRTFIDVNIVRKLATRLITMRSKPDYVEFVLLLLLLLLFLSLLFGRAGKSSILEERPFYYGFLKSVKSMILKAFATINDYV